MTTANTTIAPVMLSTPPAPAPRPPGSWASLTPPAVTRTLRVGAGQQFANINLAVQAATDGTAIELARGETFVTPGVKITKNNIIIRPFGDAAKKAPILVGKGSTAASDDIIRHTGSGLWIEGIAFDDQDDTKYKCVSFGGKNATVTKCTVTPRPDYFVIATPGSVGSRVFSCAAPQGTYKYFVYTNEGSQYLEVENCFCPDTQYENLCRTHTDHFRIIGNKFAKRHQNPLHGIFQIRQGSEGYIAFNELGPPHGQAGMQVCLGPLASETTAFLRNVVIEHEKWFGLDQLQLFHGLENLTMRDCTIEMGSATQVLFECTKSDVPRPGPSGRMERVITKGSKFITGDASRLTHKSLGNKLNGVEVK